MTEWLRLGNISAHSAQRPPTSGVMFGVIVSPYDVPEAVRGFRTSDGRFRIEFRYIDGQEPPDPVEQIDDHVSVVRGRVTRRLIAIEVDLDAIGAKSVGVLISTSGPSDRRIQFERLKAQIQSVLDRIAEKQVQDADKRAVAATREALMTREEDLLNQLTGV